ncbi:hypothetical protein ACS8MQ_22040 [Pseudomonas sp. MAHUQ-62]|uniref:hypothetical protein n=1 Tax=unclassified Pseudomonas TaxID=196821 RepID=UPI0013C40293|nr:hypothetical protein [Pseudomonas sp. DY-1]
MRLKNFLLSLCVGLFLGGVVYIFSVLEGGRNVIFVSLAVFFTAPIAALSSPDFSLFAGLRGLFLFDWVVIFVVCLFVLFSYPGGIFTSLIYAFCAFFVVLAGGVSVRRKRAYSIQSEK